MKKALLILASAAFLFAGCTKESAVSSGNTAKVSVGAMLQSASKASWDYDGVGANVDHWVVEVRDALNTAAVYYHGEKSGTKGVLQQTFDLYLVKGHTYYIAFWADKAGCFNTADLTAINCTDITKIGNSDDYDGFFKCIKHEVNGDENLSAQLFRPFSQVNIVTTDLPNLKSTTTPEAYSTYEPVDYTFKVTVPTVFSAFTGEASSEQEITIVPTDDLNHCYADYQNPTEKTTIHMVYLLTNKATATGDAKDVRDIDFSFKSGTIGLDYVFENVPLKRNYRTNIIGTFMTNALHWEIEVIPDWKGELDFDYTEDVD